MRCLEEERLSGGDVLIGLRVGELSGGILTESGGKFLEVSISGVVLFFSAAMMQFIVQIKVITYAILIFIPYFFYDHDLI